MRMMSGPSAVTMRRAYCGLKPVRIPQTVSVYGSSSSFRVSRFTVTTYWRPASSGWAMKQAYRGNVFRSVDDPDYQTLLAAARESKAHLDSIKRFDMPGFRPNVHYVREMKLYGVLPDDLADDDPIDVYQTDQAYWQSLWHSPP